MSDISFSSKTPPEYRPSRSFTPRLSQRQVLSYYGGLMGIAAVPGSGKTETVSMLIDRILGLGVLEAEQEIIVVTLVNSACNNLSRRANEATAARTLMPGVGYRVRTLHALAADIVSENPAAIGLSDGFRIADAEQCDQILRQVTIAWLRGNQHRCEWLLDQELPQQRRAFVRRERLPDLIEDLAGDFIRFAKGERLPPRYLQELVENSNATGQDIKSHDGGEVSLVEIGASLYADYQRSLSYRATVDFDDLIWNAIELLERDEGLLARLRQRWPYILEDEAQDSSAVQEHILSLLAGKSGNWVRVGDPNQAIFETFTTASPKFLRDFLSSSAVVARELPNSGRSSPKIIALANCLIDWVTNSHPVIEAREALSLPHIRATPPGDPQPNPLDSQSTIAFVDKPFTLDREAEAIADSLSRFLPENPDDTVAVLAPSNYRAAEIVAVIRQRQLRCVESLLTSTSATRASADLISNVLKALADPGSAFALADCYLSWRRADSSNPIAWESAQACAAKLRSCQALEDYLWPRLGRNWIVEQDLAPDDVEQLSLFSDLVCRWQGASSLPIDQLVLTISQDLFDQPEDMAIAFQLAINLRQASLIHPRWGIHEMIDELRAIARNRRGFAGFSTSQGGFEPAAHRGSVVVATMHKAKGLEWDRVYLTSLNAYDYPGDPKQDRFIAEKWYLHDQLNISMEACEEARCLVANSPYLQSKATYQARIDYIRERLRLLFVGITRAKRDLIVTWNTGRSGDIKPALAFSALSEWWKENGDS